MPPSWVDPSGARPEANSPVGAAQPKVDGAAAHWIALSYDRAAPEYEARFGATQMAKFGCVLAWPEVRQRLTGSVLDLGCGPGLLWQYVRRQLGLEPGDLDGWVGADLSANMISLAREQGLRSIQADAAALFFADQAFDLVLAFTSLALLPGRARLEVAESLRVLRPGGLLAATVLAKESDAFREAVEAASGRICREVRCGQDMAFLAVRAST